MAEAPFKVTIPQETVNDESVRIDSWTVASGTAVVEGQLICQIETSKTQIEIHAPVAGTLDYHYAEGDEVLVGDTLCVILPAGIASPVGTAPAPGDVLKEPAVLAGPSDADPAPAASDLPLARLTAEARKAAAEHGIDAGVFPRASLIRKNDVLRKAGFAVAETATPERPAAQVAKPSKPAESSPRVFKAAPALGVVVDWNDLPRKKVNEGKTLAAGMATTVQSAVTTSVKAPLLRERVRNLGYSDVGLDALIVFEVARLLRRYPAFNAVHDSGRIGQYRPVNIGWGLDGGQGLVAPVVKSCDEKTLAEIAAVMERHVEGYVMNSLPIEDLMGGTFTVTNLSADGVCSFTPLISQGQAAILGISSDTLAANEETFYLTLAFDHQLTEGRMAARFLRELAVRLEAHSQIENQKKTVTVSQTQDFREMTTADYHCVVCQRDYPTLQRSRAVLLKSEVPPGLVCSLCVTGF